MKKTIIAMSLFALPMATMADSLSPQNPVQRATVLADGEVMIGLAAGYGEEQSGDNEVFFAPFAAYGVTENLSIGTYGARYRFLARDNSGLGLELSSSIGLAGYLDDESELDDDALGWGADLTGKYVLSNNTALTFSLAYVLWDQEESDNKSSYNASVGVQQNLSDKVTLSASYTYSDLKDFVQDNSYDASVGLNYSFSKNTDLGAFVSTSDFDAVKNGYSNESIDKAVGVYASYRF